MDSNTLSTPIEEPQTDAQIVEEPKTTLHDLVASQGISMADFAKMTGMSLGYLYKICKDRDVNLSLENVAAIFNASRNAFGEGWDYHMYTNY